MRPTAWALGAALFCSSSVLGQVVDSTRSTSLTGATGSALSAAPLPVNDSRLLAPTLPVSPIPSLFPPAMETKAASLPSLTTFDYRQVEVQWADNHWLLRAGSVVLKDFGNSQYDARQA